MFNKNFKERIIPIPKQFEYLPGEDIVLGRAGSGLYKIILNAEPDDGLVESAVSLVTEHLSELIGKRYCAENCTDAAVNIIFSIKATPSDIANPDQGYSIEVKDGAIDVAGFGAAGLYYAAVTLKQCLKLQDGEIRLPCLKILDWPDKKTRGHLIETRFGTNLMDLDDWKRLIDHMADKKFNVIQVNVYGCWCVQYDGRVSEYLYVPIEKHPELQTPVVTKYYSPGKGAWVEKEQLPPMFEHDFLGELIAYGKTRGITVFPGINSYGHNTLIPARIPEISAKDENGEPTLTGFCTSNPKTYEVLFSIYDEIIDKYLIPNGIDSFNVGLDEVWAEIALNAQNIFKLRSPWCKCPECRGSESGALFIKHAIKIISYLKKRGMKHIYMYCDMLIDHGPNGIGQLSEDLLTELRKNDLLNEVVIVWWTYADLQEKLMFQSTRPELGLRRVTTPWNGYYNWVILSNPLRNIYLLAKMGMEENTEGMISYSSWDRSYDRNHDCLAEYSWNFTGAGTLKQMSDRYIMRNFTTQFENVRRAFQLIDLITEERIETFNGSVSVISNYHMLRDVLSYYFYSYVEKDKPYPRIFPGEALERITERREDYERAISEIASMAKEAKELLEAAALDARCNAELAGRYAYEANNFLCLAEDYLVLLDMMDLTVSECEDRFERIRELAGQRKLARLNLMYKLEKTKEPFLLSSHMRNHSIFMQLFADLESYISRTKPEDIRLDFFDMRYLASSEFNHLR